MSVKILHIINDLSRNGGAQRVVVDLVSELPSGFDVQVLILDNCNDFSNELEQGNIKYHFWRKLSLKQKWQLLRWPDIIHGHLFPSIYLGLLAFGKKRIQTEHATHNHRRDHLWLKPIEYILYRHYQLTACISYQVKQALEQFLPSSNNSYHVIENGINLNNFSQRQRNTLASNEKIKIGMVSRFHHYKDHPTLINAIALLPNNYELHLVGDGDRKNEYIELAKTLHIDDRVIFHGMRSDIADFLDSIDCYVQSSHVEGFGLAAVEAMASGLPVLASDIPGLSQIIGHDQLLFKTGSYKELANKIIDCCGNPNHYQKFSQYSLARCKDFSLQKCHERYYEAYQNLISQ